MLAVLLAKGISKKKQKTKRIRKIWMQILLHFRKMKELKREWNFMEQDTTNTKPQLSFQKRDL
jgi:hypothetical protein